MTPEQVFTQFPDADEIFKAGNSEYFFNEKDADDYCNHFNVKKEKFLRSSFFPESEPKEDDSEEQINTKKPTKAQLKAKEEAEAKAAAELKAKEEAEAKAAAELKAKEEAEAKAAAELKAKEEAEAKAAAELKAKEKAEPEGVADAIKVLESAEKDAVEASKSE